MLDDVEAEIHHEQPDRCPNVREQRVKVDGHHAEKTQHRKAPTPHSQIRCHFIDAEACTVARLGTNGLHELLRLIDTRVVRSTEE